MASFERFYDSQGKDIGLIIGSPLCGSPISVKVKAKNISVPAGSVLTFHRIMVEVKAGISGGDFITIPFQASVESGEVVEIDISSALRSIADSYEYTPEPMTYPRISFQVKAWDVYRLDGNVYDNIDAVYLPSSTQYYYALLGRYTDIERIMAGPIKRVWHFCNKPTDTPQIVCVGESIAYTPSFDGPDTPEHMFDGFSFNDLPKGPTSKTFTINKEGSNYIDGRPVYALPASQLRDRFLFRFINHLGVLDSFSCYSLEDRGNDIVSERTTLAAQESFATLSRSLIQKISDNEWISLSTGPLDRDWIDWVRHEFFMAEHTWIFIPQEGGTLTTQGRWLRCLIETDDTINAISRSKRNELSLDFKVRLDINGTINPHISV